MTHCIDNHDTTWFEKDTFTVSMGCPTSTLATPPAEPDTKSTKASLTISMFGHLEPGHQRNKITEPLNQHQHEMSKSAERVRDYLDCRQWYDCESKKT